MSQIFVNFVIKSKELDLNQIKADIPLIADTYEKGKNFEWRKGKCQRWRRINK